MKSYILSACLLSFSAMAAHASDVTPVSLDMFTPIVGEAWNGSLTYLNYQEPFEDVTIPANVEISFVDAGIQLDYKYPNEPHANSSVIASLSDDGLVFMDEPIVANSVSEDGTRAIKTAFVCEDMGRPAHCEMTYAFSANTLEISKMVTYDGETEAFRRNAYTFQR